MSDVPACRQPLVRRFNPYDFEAAPSISVDSTSSAAAAFPTSRLQAARSWASRKEMTMKQVLLLLPMIEQHGVLHMDVDRQEHTLQVGCHTRA
jgi:hypothetical protein